MIAFKQAPPHNHPFARGYLAGEGLITFALLPDDIGNVISAAKERGLDLQSPKPGGRLRPDGQQVSWEIGTSPRQDLPFLCADVTPRDLRVPAGPARQHPNGIVGIAGVVVAVHNLDESVKQYTALLGTRPIFAPPHPDGNAAAWYVGRAKLTLIEPSEGSARHTSLLERGEGPHTLVLRASMGAMALSFDPNRTHGVRVVVGTQ